MADTQSMSEEMRQVSGWRGCTMVGSDGEKIGKIDEIYLDDETGRPEWALVSTGMLGTKSNFVPLAGASLKGEEVWVAHTKGQVKDAPGVDAEGELSQQEEAELYGHYGLEYSERRSGSGLPEGAAGDVGGASTGTAGTGTGPTGTTGTGPTSTADTGTAGTADTGTAGTEGGPEGGGRFARDEEGAMTRSEEEVRVGTAERERGRARLRKWVETEEVEETVPVSRETARVEREPITDENVDEAMSGPEISEAEHEVTLHEEEPVVEKRAVPKERVRLEKDTEVDEEEVSETVRKERIEQEGGSA